MYVAGDDISQPISGENEKYRSDGGGGPGEGGGGREGMENQVCFYTSWFSSGSALSLISASSDACCSAVFLFFPSPNPRTRLPTMD